MKFDDNINTILKNFASINPSLVFKEGDVLKTISPSKTIIAEAKLKEEIESPFAIYELTRFLATLSLFDNPDIVIKDDHMVIKKDKRSIKYYFAEPSFIIQPPDNISITVKEDVVFDITEAQLVELNKALSILGLPDIAVVGDGSKIFISAADSKISDSYSIEVGDTDKTFKQVFKADNLKIMGGDYRVVIDSRGISEWSSNNVKYIITVEADASSFG